MSVRVKWKLAQSTSRPDELRLTKDYAYLTKDVTEEITKDADGNEITYFNYYTARLTRAEYEEYLAELENPGTIEVMQSVSDMQADIAMIKAVMGID